MSASSILHFGESVRPGKYGFRLVRDLYALPNKTSSIYVPREMYSDENWATLDWMYEDAEHRKLSDEFCRLQRDAALENFDLNMAYFAQIPLVKFEGALTEALSGQKSLKRVSDLRTIEGVEGVYVMVLDEHKQAYVGQSWDMRKRIKAHWAGTKQFDRLLWGNKYQSVLSINSFRALDTTRIFAARTSRPDSLERELVESIPPDYLLNRIGGGSVTGMRSLFIGTEMKRRHLLQEAIPTLEDSK